ncbi:MAG: hypothetical protein N4A31_02950 [Rickettsiales bacterium]|jgi:hypothetical protein|nr:hypothetical protein [Rickettsiales bacterium]
MTKTLNPQIISILENARTAEDAISSLNSLAKENKEFLEVRIQSFEAFIAPLLSLSVAPLTLFSISTLNVANRIGYKMFFKEIINIDGYVKKLDYIYEYDGLNSLKASLILLGVSALHKTASLTLQSIQYLFRDEALIKDAAHTIECLNSLPSDSNDIIEFCGNDGKFYISEEL